MAFVAVARGIGSAGLKVVVSRIKWVDNSGWSHPPRLGNRLEKGDSDASLIQGVNQTEGDRCQTNAGTCGSEKKCVFHAVSREVSRAIISSSFVGKTRHNKPDRPVMRPSAPFPCTSFSFSSSSGWRIAR